MNETAIKTPGVYVNEISLFPPSVAQVNTAVPAFIGYTETSLRDNIDVSLKAVQVKSLLEYQTIFGGGPELAVSNVVLDINNNVKSGEISSAFILYDAIRMFFLNGGGKCYIISVGSYAKGAPDKADFEKGLDILKKEDEPTLILFPDATKLGGNQLYDLQNAALKQCEDLGDRFTICDLKPSTQASWQASVDEFRNNINITRIKHGAAYTPYLQTSLAKNITYAKIKGNITKLGSPFAISSLSADPAITPMIANIEKAIADRAIVNGLITVSDTAAVQSIYNKYYGLVNAFQTSAVGGTLNEVQANYDALFKQVYGLMDTIIDNNAKPGTPLNEPVINGAGRVVSNFVVSDIRNLIDSSLRNTAKKLNSYCVAHNAFTGATNEIYRGGTFVWDAVAWRTAPADSDTSVMKTANVGDQDDSFFDVVPAGPAAEIEAAQRNNMLKGEKKISAIFNTLYEGLLMIRKAASTYELNYDLALQANFSAYKNIVAGINLISIDLPPSSTIAGVYAAVDNDRGVWKAPANVGLNGVIAPAYNIDNIDNDSLNVSDTGKSINAIRFFTGKGILVWGARTMDGNSNEWRYVSVRRLFIMVEESAKKATFPFVFEPNDANTWVKVRAMLNNYLTQLWSQGALAGIKPEHAFFVKCGLGQTMTAQDILEGRLIVEIGIAAVRPAEFIILRFAHKLQES